MESRLIQLEEEFQLADEVSTEFLTDTGAQLQFLDKEICSKVFTYFLLKVYVNTKNLVIVGVIAGAIAIAWAIVGFSETENEQQIHNDSKFSETDEIGSMLQKIEEDRIENEQSENPYNPKEREWVSSGPFKLDRSEYVLGERIFVNLDYVDKNTKGEMIFTKIINDVMENNNQGPVVMQMARLQAAETNTVPVNANVQQGNLATVSPISVAQHVDTTYFGVLQDIDASVLKCQLGNFVYQKNMETDKMEGKMPDGTPLGTLVSSNCSLAVEVQVTEIYEKPSDCRCIIC